MPIGGSVDGPCRVDLPNWFPLGENIDALIEII